MSDGLSLSAVEQLSDQELAELARECDPSEYWTGLITRESVGRLLFTLDCRAHRGQPAPRGQRAIALHARGDERVGRLPARRDRPVHRTVATRCEGVAGALRDSNEIEGNDVERDGDATSGDSRDEETAGPCGHKNFRMPDGPIIAGDAFERRCNVCKKTYKVEVVDSAYLTRILGRPTLSMEINRVDAA